MKMLTVLAFSILLSACATPYGKYGIAGGYTDTRIDENTFSVTVEANGFTTQQTASTHALYRAAELTVENGFDHFIVINGGNSSRTIYVATPGSSSSYTTANIYGNTAYATTTTTYSPTTVVPIVLPTSSLVIKAFKGPKPENAANAYDAKSVMKFLGPQIGVEETKK